MSIPSGSAVFGCFSTNTDNDIISIEWMGNGVLIDQMIGNSSVNITATYLDSIQTGRLEFQDLTLYFNATLIQCKAKFNSGLSEKSPGANLLIQGMWVLIILANEE